MDPLGQAGGANSIRMVEPASPHWTDRLQQLETRRYMRLYTKTLPVDGTFYWIGPATRRRRPSGGLCFNRRPTTALPTLPKIYEHLVSCTTGCILLYRGLRSCFSFAPLCGLGYHGSTSLPPVSQSSPLLRNYVLRFLITTA
jgi:hypothetical protein